eukprot:gene28207-34062_t
MFIKGLCLLLLVVVAVPCVGFRIVKPSRLPPFGRVFVRQLSVEELYGVIIEAKDAVIKEKDARFAERDETHRQEVSRLEAELLRSAGLLSARGVLEGLLKKVYETDSYFAEDKDKKKNSRKKSYTASYVAKFIDDVANGVSFEGERTDLVKDMAVWRKACKEDGREISWQKLYSALSEQIHQFPWSGRGLGVKLSGLTNIHMCLIEKMAGHYNLGVAVVLEEEEAEDEEDDNQQE